MKKKGLIISTVVMVVVLIASLTTATYAWFTASSKTSLQGFEVSVISDNAVNIGVKTNYTHYLKDGKTNTNPVGTDAFVTGQVTFTGATAGKINTGIWGEGTPGLSASLDPQIKWGAQSTAVGFTQSELNDTQENVLAKTNVHDWNGTANDKAFKGNKDGDNNVKGGKALPNIGVENGDGDYVHFILGVSPTKDLGLNNFVVAVEPTGSASSLGVLASLHIAYRMTKYGASQPTVWKDVDIYGTGYNSATQKVNVKNDATNGGVLIAGDLLAAYNKTYETTTAPVGAMAYQITDLDTKKDAITQLEVVIYMSGTDDDSNDSGKTSAGNIKMFFNTQDKTAPLANAAYTLTNENKTMEVELTGLSTEAGTKVYYQIGAGEPQLATLTANKFTITSENTITPTDVKVYQQEPNKAPSDKIGVTLKG